MELILILIFENIKAQDDGVLNRLHGTPVKQSIFIKWNSDDKVFEFNVDDKPEPFQKLNDDYIFNVKNRYGNVCRIYTYFFNPLKYNFNLSIKEVDDPNYKTISDFISKLPEASEISLNTSKSNEEIKTQNILGVSDAKNDLVKSYLLSDWFFNVSVFDSSIIKSESFQEYFNKMNKIEVFLNDKVIFKNYKESYTFYSWIKFCNDTLYSVDNDYNSFISALNKTKIIRDSLVAYKTNITKISQQIIGILTENFDKTIKTLINQNKKGSKKSDSEIKYFRNYTYSTGQSFKSYLDEQFKQREMALDNLNQLLSKLETFCSEYKGIQLSPSRSISYIGWKKEYEFTIDWKSKIMKNINYEIKKLDSKGSEISKNGGKTSFTVAKRWTLLPFMSTGLIYTDVSYPNYSIKTENSINTVSASDKTVVNYRPAIFLNFLIASWEPIYPFAQIGISSGVNDALFPVGLGISLGKNFTLSGGALLGYKKDLTNLKIGSVVSDENELKNDLKYKALTSLYFSICYSLHK